MKTRNEQRSAFSILGVILLSLMMISPAGFAQTVNTTPPANSTGGSGGGGSVVAQPTITITDAGEYFVKFTYFSANAQVAFAAGVPSYRYLAQLQGYNPTLPGEISLGNLASGTALTFQHSTIFEGNNYGPYYSSNASVYQIENLGGNKWRLKVDDGLHIGTWYNDATFEVYKKETGTADLAISGIQMIVPSVDASGKSNVAVYAEVKNAGSATSDKFDIKYYVDEQLAASETGAYGLVAGGIYSDVQIKDVWVLPGTHMIKAVISPYGADASSSNNVLTKSFDVSGVADLAVDSITINRQKYSGEKQLVFVNAIVKNTGNAASGGHTIVRYVDGAYQDQLIDYGILKPGEIKYFTDRTGAYYAPGTHTAKFVVKPSGADSNTANNVAEQQFYVEPVKTDNKAPVISGGSFPSSLKVGEQGTWSITASDPDGTYLYYKIIWGDENWKQPRADPLQSVGTFTHTYSSAGTYTVKITVSDDKGATAETSATVNVGAVPEPSCQTLPLCVQGTTPQFKGYDSNKCAIYECVPVSCTEPRFCSSGQTSQIIGYDSNNCPLYECKVPDVSNKPPVISSVSSPTSLKVGETGTWSISAYDPENGQLSYSIIWGDEPKYYATDSASARLYLQQTTFTHTYYNAGTYNVIIYAKDDKGESARSSATVHVAGKTPQYDKVASSISVEPYNVKAYDSFRVYGKITRYSSDSNDGTMKKYKVITSYSPVKSLSASGQKSVSVRLASENEGWLKVIQDYLTETKQATAAEKKAAAESSRVNEPQMPQSSAQPSSETAATPTISVVTETASEESLETSTDQKRVDYIALAPGQTESVSAYFTASSAGSYYATVRVYEFSSNARRYELVASSSTPFTVQAFVIPNPEPVPVPNPEPVPPAPPASTSSIRIYSGWNQISVPVNAEVSMEKVSAQCNSKPYAWRLTENGYAKSYVLQPGVGYWLRSSGECDYAVSSSSFSQYAPVELFAGWNVVGATSSSLSVSDSTCTITAGPWYYDHSRPKDSPYAYSSTLEPGRAYWIKAASGCAISGEDKPPAPPQ